MLDITQQKTDELRKNDFIGMVSHELKTPLTTLTAVLQIAALKLDGNDNRQLVGAIERGNIQVKRMTRMINGFLNVSRLEDGKIRIDKTAFDFDQLAAEIVDDVQLVSTGHLLSYSGPGSLHIIADREKIGSVLSNLIGNAVKYSPKGGRVDIKCHPHEKEIIVSVTDEGMGISEQDIKKIFERYYRVQTDSTTHIAGFGIGLYLSAEIVKRHDGRIWVESRSGSGSAFYFSLPRGDTIL